MPPRGRGQGATGTPPCASSLLRAPPWTPGQLLQGGKWQVPVVWAHSPRPARRTPTAPAAPARPGRGRSAPCFGAGLHSASVKLAGQPATQPHVAVHGSCQKPRFPPLQCGVTAGPHKPGGCGAPGLQGEGVWPWRGRDCRRWWLGWTLSGAWPWLLLGVGASALQMGLGGGLVASWCFSPHPDFGSPSAGRADRGTVPHKNSFAPPVWPGPAPPTRRWAEPPRAPGRGLRRPHVAEGVAGGGTVTGKTRGFLPTHPQALPPPTTPPEARLAGRVPFPAWGVSRTSEHCVLFLEGGAVLQRLGPPPLPLPSLLTLHSGS